MKNLMLTLLMTLSPSFALATAVPTVTQATPTALSPLPLTGHVRLLNAAGDMIGEVTTQGLLFVGSATGEVVKLDIMPTNDVNDTRATAYRLLMNTPARGLEIFGPAGQRVVLSLPNLKQVQWISMTGKTTSLNMR